MSHAHFFSATEEKSFLHSSASGKALSDPVLPGWVLIPLCLVTQSCLTLCNPSDPVLPGWVLIPLCLVTQSCLTLCNPMDSSPPDPSVHGDSPGKNTGVGCYALLLEFFPTQGLNPGLHCRLILNF